MAGPLSTPNGDQRIIRGHVNEEFICTCSNSKCESGWTDTYSGFTHKMIPLRDYLYARNRLVTGKTK